MVFLKSKRILFVQLLSLLLCAGMIFSACKQASDDSSSDSVAYGSLVVNSSSASSSETDSRAVYADSFKTAIVTVQGYDSAGKVFTKTSGTVTVSGGMANSIEISKIPACKNAVVTVQAYGDSGAIGKIDGIRIAAVTDIIAGSDNSVTVDWDSSKKGFVYAALLSAGVNTNTLTDAQISSINNAIPGGTHASLIDASAIAAAFKASALADSSSYILSPGSVVITCLEYDGLTLQVSDPLSECATASTAQPVTIEAAPGTWKIYVLEGNTVKATKKVTVKSGSEVNVTLGTYDGIQILVAKSLGYPLIHYWDCSDSSKYPNTTWPGIEMDANSSEDDYVYTFAGCTSVSLLITNSSGNKLYGSIMTVSSKGIYRVTASGASKISSDDILEPTTQCTITNPNELRIYQVMVASFQDGDPSIGYTQMWGPDNALKGGDLQGIIDAVDYIKDLGCNALWMTPIFQSNTGDEKLKATGYFANDYFNIDNHFGTNEKFAELVYTFHENGIAVILDGVFGHNAGTQLVASPERDGILNPGITPSTSNPVNYATNEYSLKYYSDVARYWITEYKIDGWRFDQCYQVGLGDKSSSDNTGAGGHNYWYDIRKVIEEASASNGTKGEDWGTLGYLVGEHWNGDQTRIQAGSVASGTAAGYGLNGCFDFPAYYKFVQGFACEYGDKSKRTGNITTGLSYLYQTFSEKGYSCRDDDGTYDDYYPNFMLSNHDLYRIGDVIKYYWDCDYETDEYTKRNKVLLAAQCAYTGPITIYYGDEIGDHSVDLSGGYGDNVARSSGKITGFSTREQTLHDWTKTCLDARAEHEALWNGTNEQIKGDSDFYVAKKVYNGETIYIAFNYNSSSSKTFSATGKDLLSGASFSGTVTVPALSAMYVLAE